MDKKERVLEATIKVFNRKGLKFTMEDIANELSMSKKTIYTLIRDKTELFYEMVDYCFDKIKESEAKIIQDESLDLVTKLRKTLAVLPEGYRDIDFQQLYFLKEKYPAVYRRVEERLETGWEHVIELMNQGIAEGKLKPVNIILFKTVIEATLERFFQRDVLVVNHISYSDALTDMVDMLMDGILER